MPKALLRRAVPLLHVLRGSVRIKSRETDRGGRQSPRAQNRCAEIHAGVEERRWRREVIGLLRLRKNIWDVVPLVAPSVQIYRRKKDSIGRMEHEADAWKVFGDSQARRKVMLIGVHQPSRITQLPADKNGRNAVVENQVGVGVLLVVERAGVFIAESEVKSSRGRHLPTIFGERGRSPGAQIHLRYTSLALFHGGQAKQHTGQSGAAAVIETKFGGVPGGVLVVSAVLEESPHGPDVTVEFGAEFRAVASALPRIGIPKFDRRVPGMHGCCGKSVADSGVPLNGEPRGTPGVLASEPNSLNAQRANHIVDSVILRGAVHRKA